MSFCLAVQVDVSLVTRALLVSGSALPKYCRIAVLWTQSKSDETPRYTLAYVRHTLGDSVTLSVDTSIIYYGYAKRPRNEGQEREC